MLLEYQQPYLDLPKSVGRMETIRKIVDFDQKKYLPYNLTGGFLPRLKDLYAAVFVFFENDRSLSIQIDNLDKQLLFPPELWDYIADLKIKNRTVNWLLKQDSQQDKGTGVQLLDLYMKDMPLAGLAFFGKDPRKPKKVLLFNHQSIPIGFSINGIKNLARQQKEIIKRLM